MTSKISKEPFYQYVEGVLNGRALVGKYMRLAVERFVKDCDRKDFVFDYKEGKRIVDFAALCNHWKGPKAGTPIILDPHQHFYLIQKYGWKQADNGLPRFTRTFKGVARKTGKTTEAAIEGIFHMMKGREHAAQVWTCATKEDDAIILVNDAGRIIENTPHLKKEFRLQISGLYVRRVSLPSRQAFMAYMTRGQDAVDTSMGIGDECHDWPNASVKQRIESSMGNRIAPSFTNITTAGFNKSSYCYTTLRDKSIKILEGTVQDDRHLALLFELDPEDDWKDESVWVKAAPNLPFSETQQRFMKDQFVDAVNEGGTTEVNFKTKNLNMWVDAPSVWIQKEVWEKNSHGISEEDLLGRECYGGLDLVSGTDMNSLALFFPDVREGIHAVKMLFWKPDALQLASEDHEQYVESCMGNTIDNDFVFEKIEAEIQKYFLNSIAFYNARSNHDILQALVRIGVVCNPITQSYHGLSTPSLTWEELLKGQHIEHFKNPLLGWMNSNCNVLRKANDIRVERVGGKTTGIIACINALAQWKTVEAEGKMTDFEFKSL
jgi:phage terminase large subunit-like protein